MTMLENVTLSSVVIGYYFSNVSIKNYLIGKSLSYYSQDNRGYYFHSGIDLKNSIDLIPDWYLIYEIKLYN